MKYFGIDLKEVVETIIKFLKTPLTEIKQIPNWNWRTLAALQVVIGLISGLLSALVNLNIKLLFQGIIIIPPVALATTGISTFFIYNAFLFLTQRNLPPKEIFALVIFSNIPFFVFHSFNPFFPPVTLLGFFFSALLLVVGLMDRFQLPKNIVVKVVGSVSALYLLIWILGQLESYRDGSQF